MAQSEARAWWADVQHLRDGYERTDEARRRADEADLAARRAVRERRGVEAEVSSMLSAPRRSPAALTDRPASRKISLVGTPTRFVGALVAIPEMLDIGPPGAGLRLCHAVCCPLSVRPTGLGVGLALKELRYIRASGRFAPAYLGPPLPVP